MPIGHYDTVKEGDLLYIFNKYHVLPSYRISFKFEDDALNFWTSYIIITSVSHLKNESEFNCLFINSLIKVRQMKVLIVNGYSQDNPESKRQF